MYELKNMYMFVSSPDVNVGLGVNFFKDIILTFKICKSNEVVSKNLEIILSNSVRVIVCLY